MDQMGKSPRQRGRRSTSKTLAESNNPSSESWGYEASIIGHEDILYSHGTTNAAALFGTVNMKLARYVSVQSWVGEMIAGKAMEKLVKQALTRPSLPSPTKEYEVSEDQEVPDPIYQGATMMVQVQVIKQKAEDSMMLKMETDLYMLHYKNWIEE